MKRFVYDITHHFFHYFILLMIIFSGLAAFFSFRNYPMVQLLVGIVTALSYVIWGIVHHFVDKDLNVKVIIEYLAVAIFAIIILWNLLVL